MDEGKGYSNVDAWRHCRRIAVVPTLSVRKKIHGPEEEGKVYLLPQTRGTQKTRHEPQWLHSRAAQDFPLRQAPYQSETGVRDGAFAYI